MKRESSGKRTKKSAIRKERERGEETGQPELAATATYSSYYTTSCFLFYKGLLYLLTRIPGF
jgi:hypothetical protein